MRGTARPWTGGADPQFEANRILELFRDWRPLVSGCRRGIILPFGHAQDREDVRLPSTGVLIVPIDP